MTLDCWCAGSFIDLPGWLFYDLSGWSLELWEATGLLIAPEVLLLVLAGGAALCGVVLPLVLARRACAHRLAQSEFQRQWMVREAERMEEKSPPSTAQ